MRSGFAPRWQGWGYCLRMSGIHGCLGLLGRLVARRAWCAAAGDWLAFGPLSEAHAALWHNALELDAVDDDCLHGVLLLNTKAPARDAVGLPLVRMALPD